MPPRWAFCLLLGLLPPGVGPFAPSPGPYASWVGFMPHGGPNAPSVFFFFKLFLGLD